MPDQGAESTHIRVLACTTPECSSEWHEVTVWDSVQGRRVSRNHNRAMRRARIAGWTGDNSTGCLCANREVRCSEHRFSPGTTQ